MSTNININVSGFDISELKQKADSTKLINRAQLENKVRLQQLEAKAQEAKALELKKRGTTENGQVLSGRFSLADKREEFAPRPSKPQEVTACYVQRVSFSKIEIQPRLATQPIFVDIFPEDLSIPPAPPSPYPGPSQEITQDDNPPVGCDNYSNGNLIFERQLLSGLGCVDNPCWQAFLNGLYYKKYTRLSQQVNRSINPYDGLMLNLVFPYGRGKFILVAASWFEIHNNYAYAQGYEDTVTKVVIDRVGDVCNSPPGGMITEIRNYSVAQSGSSYNQKFEAFKCFLINDISVKEISMPTKLLEILKNWSSFQSYQKNITTAKWGQLPSGNLTINNQTTSNVTQVNLSIPIVNFSFTTQPFQPLGLLSSYGRSKFNESPATILTPSIYTAINDTSVRQSVASNPSIQSYNDAFFQYYLQKESNPSPSAGSKFIATKQLSPTVLGLASVLSTLESQSTSAIGFNKTILCSRQPNLVIWNWDDQAYCKNRLISLGFTASDLA